MVASGHFDLLSTLGTLAICAATIAFAWFIAKRVGVVVDRELRQSAEARRLLTEGEDPSRNEKAQ